MGNNLDAIGTAIMTVNLELSYPNGTITTQTYAQVGLLLLKYLLSFLLMMHSHLKLEQKICKE